MVELVLLGSLFLCGWGDDGAPGKSIDELLQTIRTSNVDSAVKAIDELWKIAHKHPDRTRDMILAMKALEKNHRDWYGSSGDFGDIMRRIGPASIPVLVEFVGDESLGSCARGTLSRFGSQSVAAVKPLRKLLSETDPLRYRSQREGTWCGTALFSLYFSYPAFDVLARIGPAAIPDLTDALADPNPTVVAGAAYALAQLKSPPSSAVPALMRAWNVEKQTPKPNLQQLRMLAWTLGKIGPGAKDAVPLLIAESKLHPFTTRSEELLLLIPTDAKGEAEEKLRRERSELIEEIGWAIAEIDPESAEGLAVVVHAYLSRNGSLLGRGEKVHLGASSYVEVLKRIVAKKATTGGMSWPKVCLQPPVNLARAQRLVALDYAAAGCRSSDEAIRAICTAQVRSLQVPGKSVDELLRRMLDDASLSVQLEAGRALLTINPGDDGAISALVNLVCTRSSLAWESLQELSKLPKYDSKVLKAFRAGFAHPESNIRELCIDCLDDVGEKGAALVPDLIKLLDSADVGTRRRAAEALGSIGPAARSAIPAIVQRIDRTYESSVSYSRRTPEGREYTSGGHSALGRIGPDALAELLKMVSVEYPADPCRAIALMGDKGAPAVDAMISEIKRRPDYPRCVYFIETLGAIGPKASKALPVLREFAERRRTNYEATRAIASIEGRKIDE